MSNIFNTKSAILNKLTTKVSCLVKTGEAL
jgi:hypothetical protein